MSSRNSELKACGKGERVDDLLIISRFDWQVGNLDFQKLLFLYCQEPDSGSPYEFVPYKFGAFSFTSYADRRNAHVG